MHKPIDKDREIEILKRENDLLRMTVETLSKEHAAMYSRTRGAEYVEARAERIKMRISPRLSTQWPTGAKHAAMRIRAI